MSPIYTKTFTECLLSAKPWTGTQASDSKAETLLIRAESCPQSIQEHRSLKKS